LEEGAEPVSSKESTVVISEEAISEVDTTPVLAAVVDETKITGSATSAQADRVKSEMVKSGGNETFKENPYTFLSSDDTILISCVWVVGDGGLILLLILFLVNV
jgi:multisite-specific tRNA:(cytosine-C5)-methyltransferase